MFVDRKIVKTKALKFLKIECAKLLLKSAIDLKTGVYFDWKEDGDDDGDRIVFLLIEDQGFGVGKSGNRLITRRCRQIHTSYQNPSMKSCEC